MMIERILATYGVTHKHILPVQKGYRNESYPVELASGQLLNLILYKREPGIATRIKHANAVADFIASRGLPARKTYHPKIVQLTAGTQRKYAALYHYLPGHTIPWEAYTQNHIKLLGMTMSRMHKALQNLQLHLPLVSDEYEALVGRMANYFPQPGVHKALRAKLNLEPPVIKQHLETLEAASKLPNHHPLHMDFVRGNILFGDDEKESLLQLGNVTLTGILDFEKTALGPPVFDIARTLAFLLVDSKFKTEPKIRKYFLQSGYIKRGGGNPNLDLLEPLTDLFLLHDFYKFLRHNPYESLPNNEHFTRTRAILLARKVIKQA